MQLSTKWTKFLPFDIDRYDIRPYLCTRKLIEIYDSNARGQVIPISMNVATSTSEQFIDNIEYQQECVTQRTISRFPLWTETEQDCRERKQIRV